MTQQRIIFCTTAKGRTQHIEQTLPANLRDNAGYENCKLVLVGSCDPGPLRDYLWNRHQADMESGRLAIYHHFGNEHFGGARGRPPLGANWGLLGCRDVPFRMAHAKNMAHRLGILEGGEILVNLDADNFTGPGFAKWIAKQFTEWCSECGGVDVEKIKGLYPALADKFEPCPKCEGRGYDLNRNIFLCTVKATGDFRRGVSGRIIVTANAFLKAGGYDERYETWAPDDKDFNARLQRLGYRDMMIDRHHIDAVHYNDKIRFREYPQAKNKMEEYEAQVAVSENTVVNFGRFGEGIVFKNFGSEPIVLGPLPTRIFGIGLHKTCTTSLYTALGLLGFEAAHWEGPQWAKNIWLEMRAGRSLTVEKCYAITDLPITLLYRELDKAYPGSKFILTVRDEAKWLDSVRRHWSYERNPWRATWDNEPAAFTHRIHHELYGQRHFDAEVFLARYRRHNAEVRDYFKGRYAEDFLVLEMENPQSQWGPLCRFLDRPVPTVNYPVAMPY